MKVEDRSSFNGDLATTSYAQATRVTPVNGRHLKVSGEHATVSVWAVRAKTCWQAQGKPEYLFSVQVHELQKASKLERTGQSVERSGRPTNVQLELPPQSIAAIRFDHAAQS